MTPQGHVLKTEIHHKEKYIYIYIYSTNVTYLLNMETFL